MAERKGSIRTVLGKTKNYGTPAEKRAVDKGLKAAAKAQKEGKSKKEADAIGKKITTNQMKTDRGKTNVEALWLAASAIPGGLVGGAAVRGGRAAFETTKKINSLFQKAKLKSKPKRKPKTKSKPKNPGPGDRPVPVNKNYVVNKDGTPKIRGGKPVPKPKPKTTPKGTPKTTPKGTPKTKPKTTTGPRGKPIPAKDGLTTAQKVAFGTAAVAIPTYLATRGKDAENIKRGFNPKKKTATVKKPTGKMSASEARKLDSQTADEVGSRKMQPTSVKKKKPEKRKTLGEAMFGSDQTPRNQTVKNPFTGNDMTIDYSDNYEAMKMGGKVKRRMGGKVRGYGKAQRGY